MPIEAKETPFISSTSTSINVALAMSQARQTNNMPRINGNASQTHDFPPYNKSSQPTSKTTSTSTAITKTAVRSRGPKNPSGSNNMAASSSTSQNNNNNNNNLNVDLLESRRSDRAKTPLEELRDAIVQPLTKFSMVGVGRVRSTTSGSKSSLSPPPSLHNETFSTSNLDSVGEDTTTMDYSRLEREVQAEKLGHGFQFQQPRQVQTQPQSQSQSQSQQQKQHLQPSRPAQSQSGQSRMSHQQTVTQNGTVRPRNLKKNIDKKAYEYTEEGMSEDDLDVPAEVGIATRLPVRSTRLSNSQSTHARPRMNLNGSRNGNGNANVNGRGGVLSPPPESLSGSSERNGGNDDDDDDEEDEDVFGTKRQPVRGFQYNKRAQMQQQRERRGTTPRRLSFDDEEEGTTAVEDNKQSLMGTDLRAQEDDEAYAKEKAPFNRAGSRFSSKARASPGVVYTGMKRKRVVLPDKRNAVQRFFSTFGIERMDGPSLAKLFGLILLVFWAGLAIRHTWREIQETINSISGAGRGSVGLPLAQDLAGDSTWRYYHDETVQRLDGQAGEIKEIEGRLRSLTTQVQSAATGLTQSELDRSQRDVRTEFQKLRAEDQAKIGKEIEGVNGAVMRLKEEMNRLKSETGKGNTEVMKELRRIETLMKDHKRSTSNDMSEVKARLSKVETEMLKMFDEKLWKQTLERILPTFVPFHRDGSGKMRVDPLFWTEMKKMFASERSITESATRQQPAHQPSWKDFIEENDEKLKQWLQNSLGDKAFYTESMHSGVFQDLLDDEVAKLKASLLEDMRARAAEGDKKVKRELDQMRAEAREAAGLRWGQKVSDEVLVESAFSVQQLIDHALLTYSKDTIAKADYALASSGSTVLNHQTSPSLELTRPGFLGRMWGRKARARDPRVALQGLNDPGYCWAFAGSKGSLGIGLASRIRVTDITIEHAARELVPKSALSSAPRDVEMWAIPATPEEHQKIENWLEWNPDHQSDRVAPAPGALLLMTAEYDPHTERPLQTFQVPHQIQELGVVTENVVAKFNENWGAEYTCLYRLRVHGEPI